MYFTGNQELSASVAEIRRIERDLHDGAQARLVAMGITLGWAEAMLDKDPEGVRRLLIEAREASARALSELRDLVHGIHPAVLAERGLGDAVRARVLELPMKAEVTIDLPGELDAPVESAAYYGVSEILTNAVKHSGAEQVWLDLRHSSGRLRIRITDNGRGGADAATGTGLRGIQRRLAAFDGLLALSSPAGGPTVVTMELPSCFRGARDRSWRAPRHSRL